MADLLYQGKYSFFQETEGQDDPFFPCGKEGLAISAKQGTIMYGS